MIKYKKVLFVGSVFGCCVALFIAAGEKTSLYVPGSLEATAQAIVNGCADADHTPTCYDEEIPKLMDAGLSMEDAFEVTRVVQEIDPSYQYCHVLGHYLSAKETAKDPEKWKDVISRAPTGVCSNGSIHGAFQERFRTDSFEDKAVEEIVPELTDICTPREGWEATPMGVATCIHALGHLTMYVTGGNIDTSLALCDELLPNEEKVAERQLCYDGAFMQIYQPLDPEDFALIKGQEVETQEEAKAFCGQFEGPYFSSCTTESWPHYTEEMEDPNRVTTLCDPLINGGWQYTRCMSAVFYVAMARSNLSVDWVSDFCPQTPEGVRGQCFANAASRLIETDERNVGKALQVCSAAASAGEGAECYDELLLYSTYTLVPGSDPFIELCTGLPGDWGVNCLKPVSGAS